MQSTFALDTKEQVRQAVDIVDLVGSYTPLRRQGRNYVALCPWHDDSRPSLQVNPDRQSFKCWVCDIGGDVFSFVMRMEGLEFREALEMLAERTGIAVEAPQSQGATAQPSSGAGDKQLLYRAMVWAEEQFHRALVESPEAEPAREYLAERKINAESIERFRLGFAPNRWDWLLGQAQHSEATAIILERVGLLIRRDTGDGFYDRFRGRLMFPIRDVRSRPIAFGGRVLPQLADEHSGGKYINSPETPLFNKSREFYGLDLARDAVIKSRSVIVMEGYTDCLMAHQHGVENVIAVLGTALGERHLPVLRRFADSITLVLDGDEAGRRRANEILELFVANEVELRILTLPDELDPCDVIASQGGDAFRQLVSQAVDALEHKLNLESNGLDVHTETHRATQAAERVLATLAEARSGPGVASSTVQLREQQMLTRTARRFGLPIQDLHTRMVALHKRKKRRPLTTPAQESSYDEAVPQATRPSLSQWTSWERELMELVLLDASHLATISPVVEPAAVRSPVARGLYVRCVELWQDGITELYGRLMLETEDADIKHLLVTLDDASREKAESDSSRRIHDLLETHANSTNPKTQVVIDSSTDVDAALASFLSTARPAHRHDYERRKQ